MYPHQAERLTAELEREGLEALVAATPANVRYITGFRSLVEAIFHTSQFAVFSRRGTALVVPAVDVLPIVLDAITVDHVVCFGELAVPPTDPPAPGAERLRALLDARADDPAQALAQALDALDVRSGRVGVDEMGVSAPLWSTLADRLAPRTVVPASDRFLTARRVKAPYELECLERALHIAEEALNVVIQVLKPGVTEREAVGLYEAEVLKRGAETYPAIVAFRERTAVLASWPTDRALRSGDLVRFDLGCVFKGYYASLARTAVMGAPDERQQQLAGAIEAGLEAALATIRPGVLPGQVHQAALAAAQDVLPVFLAVNVGHGIGLEPCERPTVAPATETPFEAAEVLRVDMPYFEPGWGAVHLRDTAMVTTRSHHVLNRSIRGLVVLD
jgi:Xaa-Pro dipeptidase